MESFDANITGIYSPGDSEVRAKELSFRDALKENTSTMAMVN